MDQVLAAMVIGVVFQGETTLHRGALAHFMLLDLSPALEVDFSICQGAPESSPLY